MLSYGKDSHTFRYAAYPTGSKLQHDIDRYSNNEAIALTSRKLRTPL
ncbi:MAG: hypothetical protein HC903_25045 [Methylacidiphilales bacterium]|nr:hypothetical protein [Candidatus Methylacidiphilales bacterium]